MKRVNIYITEKEENELDYLSEILDCKSRSEIVRKAIDEYSKKYKKEIEEFSADLIENSSFFTEIDSKHEYFLKECEKSPAYFVKNTIKIINPDEGSVPFVPYQHQLDLLQDIDLYNELIINKSRQSGISTIACAYIVNYLLYNNHKTVVISAPRQADAEEIIRKIKHMLINLPDFMKVDPDLSLNNKRRIEYNKNRVYATSLTCDAAHGINVDVLYLDDISHVKKGTFDNFYAAVIPNIASRKNYKMIITGTPNGYNHFYSLWANALSNYNNLRPIAIPWEKVPGRDETWKKQMISAIGELKFEEEFNCQFVNRTSYAV